MSDINPYLQATANFAHYAAKHGSEAGINGSLDKFIDRLAKFMAYESSVNDVDYMDSEIFNSLTIDEFTMMCWAYGVWDVEIGAVARDWFVTKYREHYNKFIGFETNDAECL